MDENLTKPKNIIREITIAIGLIIIGVLIFFAARYAPRIFPSATQPKTFSLPVPYTTQAPDNNWVGNEDCEEASIVMANAYLTGNTSDVLPAADAVNAINNLVSWEQTNFGYSTNTGAEQTAKIAEAVDNLKVQIVDNYTEQQMKQALLNHEVILLMINAQGLHNPDYGQNAPIYHVVVVYGYDGDAFIVHDPGTNTGESNKYTFAELFAAGEDWNNVTNTLTTNRKVALFLSK